MSFLSGIDLLKEINNLDAVFLDIEMPDMNGFEVAKFINNKNSSCKIIMATGNLMEYKEAFKINAFRFITKPFKAEEIEEAIDSLIALKIGEESLCLYLNRVPYYIPQKEIIYFKSYNGYCVAKVKEKHFRINLSLNELKEVIDTRLFIQTHRQYIINLKYIEEYQNIQVKVKGDIIPVSRRMKKEFEERYTYFDVKFRGC